jgi:phage repressor protein C with HTH and peptisase S24 domain
MVAKNNIKTLAAAAGLTIPKLASLVDMQAPALRRYTRQEVQPNTNLAERLARALDCSMEEVIGQTLTKAPRPTVPFGKLPLYGAAQGGVGADISDVSEPLEFISPPPWINENREAYAVYVVGESMEPRYYSGEIVFAQPGSPARPHDFVVAQLRDESGGLFAIIKQLISVDTNTVVFRQFNPDATLSYEKSQVRRIHVIRGSQSR